MPTFANSRGKCLVLLGVMLLSLAAPPLYANGNDARLILSQGGASADNNAGARASTRAPGDGLKYPAGRWYFQTSALTRHVNPSPEHTNYQRMLDFEYWNPDRWIWGATFLRNSFNQPTQYIYMGRLWRPLNSAPMFHLKLTGGVIHGYKGEYRDKIPFNHYGYAPALMPSIGISGKWFASEIVILGTAAMMITVGTFWE